MSLKIKAHEKSSRQDSKRVLLFFHKSRISKKKQNKKRKSDVSFFESEGLNLALFA